LCRSVVRPRRTTSKKKWNWIGHTLRGNDDNIANQCCSGCHKATEEADDRETLAKEIWREKCGQRASGLAGGIWRRQHKTERDGDELLVAYAPLEATRHKVK